MEITSTSIKVRSELKFLSEIRSFINETAGGAGLPLEKVEELQLAVDEACANIIIHGYKNNTGDINIDVLNDKEKVIVSLTDNAPLYNPLKESPHPQLDTPLEERALGGMGVLIVKQNTDYSEYKITENGENKLIMTKCHN